MPSRSLAQERYVRAMAAQGKPWAKKWIEDERGAKIPHVQHVQGRGKKVAALVKKRRRGRKSVS